MLRNPVYWRSYYHGSEDEIQLARIYSYSDRCRYYWGDAKVQQELAQLRANLDACPVNPTWWVSASLTQPLQIVVSV
jgi:D-tagatose-1,6-bisphosphate aldolase subunit GatZ/KbaZ